MAENKLEFDKIEHDVSIAKAYFEGKNYEIHPSIIPKGKCEKFKDDFGNTIHLSTDFEPYAAPSEKQTFKCDIEQLYKELKSNIDLFAQLDYMLRNIPVDETKDVNIKLILNEMQDFILRKTVDAFQIEGSACILFDDEAPLAVLGRMFEYVFKINCNVEIIATPETAPIASLFVQLCLDTGFPVRLHLMKKEVIRHSKYFEFIPSINKAISEGTVAVVMETADVDSAVESLLASYSKLPWRISQVFVQESQYESFQKSLKWKCQRVDTRESTRVAAEIRSRCAAVYESGDKAFLLDYAGARGPRGGELPVRAFRTRADLRARTDGLTVVWGQEAGGAAAAGGTHVSLNDGVAAGALHRAFYSSFYAPRFEAYPREHAPWPDRRTLITFLDEHAHREADRSAAVFKQMLLQFPERPDRVSVQDGGLSVVMTSPADVICAPYRGDSDVTRVAEGLALAFFSNSLFVVQLMKGGNVDGCLKLLGLLIASQESVPIYLDRSCELICSNAWYRVKSMWTKFKMSK